MTVLKREQARLDELERYQILDSPAEEAFDRIAALTASVFDVPFALISFIGETRQWVKSKVGLDLCDMDREAAFCSRVFRQGSLVVIPDMHQDERFASSPFVTEEPHIRFYAGAPLFAPNGAVLGTLCILDSTPRALLSAREEKTLKSLAALVVDELELRRESARAQAAEIALLEEKRLVESILSSLPGVFYIIDAEGRMVRWNRAFEQGERLQRR